MEGIVLSSKLALDRCAPPLSPQMKLTYGLPNHSNAGNTWTSHSAGNSETPEVFQTLREPSTWKSEPGGGRVTVLVLPALRDRLCYAGSDRSWFWCLASEILAEGSPIPVCGGSIQEESAGGD